MSTTRVEAAAASETCRANTMTIQAASTPATTPAIRRRVRPAIGSAARSGGATVRGASADPVVGVGVEGGVAVVGGRRDGGPAEHRAERS